MSSGCCPSGCTPFLKSRQPPIAKAAVPTESTRLNQSDGNGGDDDILITAGVKLPAMFQTKFRRWVMLLLFNVINSIASGPMTMFPTLEPIMVQEKVFPGRSQMGQYSTLYSMTLGVIMMSMLPLGIAFDSYGPKWMAVVGTLLFAVFSTGIGISMRFQSLNWLLYFFYPMALVCGYGKSFGAYGYQWLLPDDQNTVNAVTQATQSLSDALVLVCVWLHHSYGMQLWTYFWALAVLSVFTAMLNSVIVPSRKEHTGYAAAVIAVMQRSGSGYEYGSDTNSKVVEEAPIKTSGWRWWDHVKGVSTTFQTYRMEHFLFIGGSCSMYMFSWYPTMQMYPFYTAMFGTATATKLVDLFAVVYGVLGALATICSGRVLDTVGFKKSIILINALNFAALGALLIPTFQTQVIFQVCLSLSIGSFMIFAMRFCMLYAPMQLFGTYNGVITFIMGIFQISVSSALSLFKARTVNHSRTSPLVIGESNTDVIFVQAVSTGFCLLSALFFTLLVIHLQWFPLPEAGSISCRQAGIPEESEYEAESPESEDSWL